MTHRGINYFIYKNNNKNDFIDFKLSLFINYIYFVKQVLT